MCSFSQGDNAHLCAFLLFFFTHIQFSLPHSSDSLYGPHTPPHLSVTPALVPHPRPIYYPDSVLPRSCLSLSLLFLLAVMFSLLYHPSFWPVCALVPRCVWVKMCLLCRGDASLRGASPAGHYNFHWECVLPCVCVWACDCDLLKSLLETFNSSLFSHFWLSPIPPSVFWQHFCFITLETHLRIIQPIYTRFDDSGN